MSCYWFHHDTLSTKHNSYIRRMVQRLHRRIHNRIHSLHSSQGWYFIFSFFIQFDVQKKITEGKNISDLGNLLCILRNMGTPSTKIIHQNTLALHIATTVLTSLYVLLLLLIPRLLKLKFCGPLQEKQITFSTHTVSIPYGVHYYSGAIRK